MQRKALLFQENEMLFSLEDTPLEDIILLPYILALVEH